MNPSPDEVDREHDEAKIAIQNLIRWTATEDGKEKKDEYHLDESQKYLEELLVSWHRELKSLRLIHREIIISSPRPPELKDERETYWRQIDELESEGKLIQEKNQLLIASVTELQKKLEYLESDLSREQFQRQTLETSNQEIKRQLDEEKEKRTALEQRLNWVRSVEKSGSDTSLTVCLNCEILQKEICELQNQIDKNIDQKTKNENYENKIKELKIEEIKELIEKITQTDELPEVPKIKSDKTFEIPLISLSDKNISGTPQAVSPRSFLSPQLSPSQKSPTGRRSVQIGSPKSAPQRSGVETPRYLRAEREKAFLG